MPLSPDAQGCSQKLESDWTELMTTLLLAANELLLTVLPGGEMRVTLALPSQDAIIARNALLPRVAKNLDAEALVAGIVAGKVAV